MASAPGIPATEQVSAPRPLALLLPLLAMAAGALETPAPWNRLWIAVPVLGAAGYLANLQRWRLGWLAPLAAAAWVVTEPQAQAIWGWVLVGATACASLFGLARRSGAREPEALWALLPLLGLALAFPFSSLYAGTVRAATTGVEAMGEEAFRSYRALGLEGATLAELARQVEWVGRVLSWLVSHVLPAMLFAWSALLVGLSILLARRAARAVGRPLAPGAPFAHFRLPEGAVWMLLLGLALVAVRRSELLASGVNLVLCLAMGYCLQGLAVMDFAMLMRGFAPGVVWILFLFVTLFASPVLVVASTGLGVADVWLDLRRRAQAVEKREGEV